ncbi:MAG: thermonuclease family protein [Rickettsiales bacterium]|jgi:endonuclease YncB( thermonuclease family)|nr:thermonuclease family protein [Rickettsiales bacterium]
MIKRQNEIMKKFIAVLFFCFFIFPALASDYITATSGYVFDGDTFAAVVELKNDVKISVRVRILGIDAPEIHGECKSEIQMANKAKKYLETLLPNGTNVILSDIKDDKYLGRIDANVKLDDGRDVATIMLKQKMVRPYGGKKRKPWCI